MGAKSPPAQAGSSTRLCSGAVSRATLTAAAAASRARGGSSPHRPARDVDPDEGSIPAHTLDAILEHCPADGDVVQAVWDGFGFWTDPERDVNALMRGRGRDHLLLEAPKVAVTSWPGMERVWSQSANLIWPKDHSWCVATEIDWDSTLVAAPTATCAALLADDRLETFEVDYDDNLNWYGDTINPRPAWLTPPPRQPRDLQ